MKPLIILVINIINLFSKGFALSKMYEWFFLTKWDLPILNIWWFVGAYYAAKVLDKTTYTNNLVDRELNGKVTYHIACLMSTWFILGIVYLIQFYI